METTEKTYRPSIEALHKVFTDMCTRTGFTPDSVFEGLLDYIIGYLNPSLTPEPIEGWKFKPQHAETFAQMLDMVMEIYKKEIPRLGWYDPFGDLYMAIHSGGNGKGQFFTPPSVAQVVAQCNVAGWSEPAGQPTPFGHRIIINDCASGSGRMPLAAYVAVLHQMQHEWGYTPAQAEAQRPYLSCEDLDFNCVKMAAINMAFHGCFGEAVVHNTLTEPGEVLLGYIINETMYPFQTDVPSIRKETNPLKFTATRLWALRQKAQQEKQAQPAQPEPTEEPTAGNTKQPVQLSLF